MNSAKIQLEHFEKLLGPIAQHGFSADKLPLPKAVLSFAEVLMICPTESLAKAHIESYPEEAKGFLDRANEAAPEGENKNIRGESEKSTPFGEVSTVVILKCRKAIEQYGNSWVCNSDFRARQRKA